MLRRWLQPVRRSRHGPREAAERQTSSLGSNTLTAAERAALRVDPIVTDALIDDLLPAVEQVAQVGSMVIDADARRESEAEVRQQADAARAFRALLEDPTRLGYSYFVRRWVERGMPRRDAERRFVHLLTDLNDLETELRLQASEAVPLGVSKGDAPVDRLVLTAAVSWRQYTGQQPDTSEPSAFVRFCMALAALAELPLSRDRIRSVLDRGP
jgi:hypothetical protein